MERNTVGRVGVCAFAVMIAVSGAVAAAPSAAAVNRPPLFLTVDAPTGGDGTMLRGVECTSATACIAVGSSGNYPNSHGGSPTVERWNGREWSLTYGVQALEGTQFAGIACPAPASCFAVGGTWSIDPPRTGSVALIEHWDGSEWSLVKHPRRAGSDLSAIACPAPTSCIAVGSGGDDTGAPLIETWNGSTWSVAATPPTTRRDHLSGVACATPRDCMAVGSTSGHSRTLTFALHWNGQAWSQTRTLDAARDVSTFNVLSGVACPAVDSCTAVGSVTKINHVTGSIYDEVILEHWNGHAWSMDAPPGFQGQLGELLGVACAAPRHCVAVGGVAGDIGAGDFGRAVIDASNGRVWSSAEGPPDEGDEFDAIACPTVEHCVAVGALFLGPQDPGALVAISRRPPHEPARAEQRLR